MRIKDYMVWKCIRIRRRITTWVQDTRFRLIIWAIRKYYSETISYDPDYQIYIFRWTWTKDLEDHLCGQQKPEEGI